MTQRTLDLRIDDMATARAVGEVGAQRATDKAERQDPGFSGRAEAAILARLAPKGSRASSEDLTEHVKQVVGFEGGGQCLGSIYASMNRRGLIRIVGDCYRKRGNGTSGGHIWERCSE